MVGGRGVVPQVLEEYGRATRRVLRRYLAPRAPARQLYRMVADYPRRGGRMLRPSLCIATARVFGATVDDAVHAAAALELLHNAFLVHDDVEDESEQRRGRPTLNALYGVPVAVNVGDALALLGLRALMGNRAALGPRVTMRLLEEAEHMARQSIEGQAIELGWRRENAVALREADYLEMVLKKTCWYTTIHPSRIGALIGTGSEEGLDRFVRFGFFLGAAFQIQDDVLNLVGEARAYGKEIGGDVWEGKRTLVLIHLLREATAADRRRIERFLATPRARRGARDVAWVRRRMDDYGSITHASRVAHALAGAAQHECEALYAGVSASRDREFIAALPEWVLARN